MLLGSHIPERDYDMASIQAQRLETATSHTEAEEKNVRIGQHSGKQIPSLNLFREGKEGASGVSLSEVDVLNLINSKGESASDVLLPMDLVGPLEGVDAVAEWMHILRPVIYLIALQRCGTKSWNPWLLSLALEVTSLGIHANSSRKHKFLERDEMQRRAWLLAYYLLRDPVYSLFVKERLNKFCDAMAKRPIISLASNLLADYIPLWENYYFLVNP
ncbi:peroxisome membrane protein [Chytriomyces sp. MP71]|nr:peroxisome membrane protein [Chytriomyces sp. MP71]